MSLPTRALSSWISCSVTATFRETIRASRRSMRCAELTPHTLGDTRGRDRRRRHLPDPHFAQRVAHGIDRVPHLRRADRADAADAKSLHLRELAGVEDETLVAHSVVELLEAVLGIRRCVEGHDNRRLDLRIEKSAEAELAHPGRERLIVRPIARESRRLPAGGDILLERRVERDDHVRGRRIAPLRRALHVRPLIVKIERQRGRVAGAALEHALLNEHEAHARRPFDALAGCGYKRVEWNALRI